MHALFQGLRTLFGFSAIGVDGVKVGKHAHFREPIDPNKPNPPVNDGLDCLTASSGSVFRLLPVLA